MGNTKRPLYGSQRVNIDVRSQKIANGTNPEFFGAVSRKLGAKPCKTCSRSARSTLSATIPKILEGTIRDSTSKRIEKEREERGKREAKLSREGTILSVLPPSSSHILPISGDSSVQSDCSSACSPCSSSADSSDESADTREYSNPLHKKVIAN